MTMERCPRVMGGAVRHMVSQTPARSSAARYAAGWAPDRPSQQVARTKT
jgi:hypothetical protein